MNVFTIRGLKDSGLRGRGLDSRVAVCSIWGHTRFRHSSQLAAEGQAGRSPGAFPRDCYEIIVGMLRWFARQIGYDHGVAG